MKRVFTAILVLIITLFLPLSVSAQVRGKERFNLQAATGSAWQKRILQPTELNKQLKEEIMQRIRERKATRSAQLVEFRKERIRFFFGLMTTRMEAATSRLEKLISRIEARITKIESENAGIDTSVIKKDVQKAKDLLDE